MPSTSPELPGNPSLYPVPGASPVGPTAVPRAIAIEPIDVPRTVGPTTVVPVNSTACTVGPIAAPTYRTTIE